MSFAAKKMFSNNAWFMGFNGPRMHTKWAKCGQGGGGKFGHQPLWGPKNVIWSKKKFPNNAWFMGFDGPKMHTKWAKCGPKGGL